MKPFDLCEWELFPQKEAPAVIDQVAINSREIHSGQALFVAIVGNMTDGHNYLKQAAENGAKFAIVSKMYEGPTPDSLTLIRVDDPVEGLQSLACCYRKKLQAKIIAIVGSYGKTTTKDLLHHLLAETFTVYSSPESFNSQIGVALTLLEIEDEEIALVEAGISHLGEMERLVNLVQPDCAILTQLGIKYLAQLKDRQTIASEMEKMLNACPKENWTLAPNSITATYHWKEKQKELPHITVNEKEYEISFPSGEAFQGTVPSACPYYEDLLNTCMKAAWLLRVEKADLLKKVTTYTPEPVKTEIWHLQQGALIINDKYGASPLSIEKSLRLLNDYHHKGRRFFLFGGLQTNKTQNSLIIDSLLQHKPDFCFLLENKANRSLYEQLSPRVNTGLYPTIDEALGAIRHQIREDDSVLIKGPNKISMETIANAFHEGPFLNQYSIHLSSIEHNIQMLRTKATGDMRLMVMVKALGYGTNPIQLSKFLEKCGVDILGVAHVDEAIALRSKGVSQEIFIIHTAPFEAYKLTGTNFQTAVSSLEEIEALAKVATSQKIKVHLHVDTGMKRFGCKPEEALKLAKEIDRNSGLILHGLMTHFATAEEEQNDDFSKKQIEKFRGAVQELKEAGIEVPWIHASNTSALLRFSIPECNMARVGIGVFGLFLSEASQKLDLRPALSLTSKIVAFNECRIGESVGYGCTFKAEKRHHKIAIVPLGHSDGLHRQYKSGLHVTIHGKEAPIVGNICMDYMMVDVTHISEAIVGDSVLIFGKDPSGFYSATENVAFSGGTTPHELIACLGPRIQRVFTIENSGHL